MGWYKASRKENVEDQLIAVARTIKFGPGYGRLYWNDALKKVHWTAGDSDCAENGATPLDEVEKRFAVVPGVKDVEIGDEWSPKAEDGFVEVSFL